MKKIVKCFPVFLVLIAGRLVFSSCDRSTDNIIEPTKATIAKAGKVYSNYAMDLNNAHNKIYSEEINEAKSGQGVLIMEGKGWDDFKIQLPDGSIGWIKVQKMEPKVG